MSPPRHRGPHVEDPQLFAPRELPTLRAAVEEVSWLLGRGYRRDVAQTVVGNHHQLALRQRVAVGRAACADETLAARERTRLGVDDVRGRALAIDGWNLLITLEVALSRGLLVRGRDGCVRDLAALRGSYRTVEETVPAIALVAGALDDLGAASACIVLDANLANSRRVAALFRAAPCRCPLTVELPPNADPLLVGGEGVVSADAAVLDRAASWLNLAAWIVDERVPGAWVVSLATTGAAE